MTRVWPARVDHKPISGRNAGKPFADRCSATWRSQWLRVQTPYQALDPAWCGVLRRSDPIWSAPASIKASPPSVGRSLPRSDLPRQPIAFRRGAHINQVRLARRRTKCGGGSRFSPRVACRSEEHTSELQSLAYLVCRLLLEKKKQHQSHTTLN